MASYQNTSGYYCGINVNTHPGHCPNPNVYFNQNPCNFHTQATAYYPENYKNQEIYPETFPGGTIYNPTHRPIICNNNNNGNGYGHVSQYNTIQNTPFTTEPVTYPVFYQEPKPQHKNQYMGRKHHAHITILPSSKGNFKAHIKRKRKRTIFTTEQVTALENIFKRKQYINRGERLAIVNNLQINDKAIKIWFQNRRLKIKRQQSQDTEEEVENSIAAVESEINEKTDQNGLVSLDDRLMTDLVNVIDAVLTKNNVDVPFKEIVDSDSSSPYEPISPASVSDNNEEDSLVNWRPSEPNASLQKLFDLQSMLLI